MEAEDMLAQCQTSVLLVRNSSVGPGNLYPYLYVSYPTLSYPTLPPKNGRDETIRYIYYLYIYIFLSFSLYRSVSISISTLGYYALTLYDTRNFGHLLLVPKNFYGGVGYMIEDCPEDMRYQSSLNIQI